MARVEVLLLPRGATDRMRMSAARLVVAVATALLTAVAPGVARAQASPSDYTYATRYDASDRPVGTIAPDPDGTGPLKYAATRTTYDDAGQAVRVEKGELSIWKPDGVAPLAWGSDFQPFTKVETGYDAMGRKTAEALWGWDATLATPAWVQKGLTQYGSDDGGRLECTAVRMNPATWESLSTPACTLTAPGSDGPDRITRTEYDAAGQVLKVIKAYRQTAANGLEPLQQDYATYSYTVNGKPATMKDANGNVAGYDYDGFDRQVRWRFPSKNATGSISATDYEEYSYDPNGNRVSLRKRDGQVIGYSYDALNRATVKDVPGGTAADVYSGYDLRNLLSYARFASDAGTGIGTIYDGFGRVSSTTNDMGASAQTLGYEYDPDGNRTKLTYPDGAVFAYVNDGLDRLSTIKDASGTAIVSSLYDAQGRLASQVRGGVTTTLGYDAASRLASLKDDLAEPASGPTNDLVSTFSYTPGGQIAGKTRSNYAYAFTGYVTLSRGYTANGLNQYTNAGSVGFVYDANGNLTGDGTNSYTYDAENRMVAATVNATGYTLKYDPLGRLWQVVLPTKTLEFVHDGDAIVKEYNGATPVWYVHGPGDDDPMIQYNGAGLATRYSLQPDAQGSIVSIADAGGAKAFINTYDEYGIAPTANFGRFQYTGQAWLAQLGLYYYKARMYSPTLGRFMQTDPIGYEDQNNLYAYVGNDPINGRDPDGQMSVLGGGNDSNGGGIFSPDGRGCALNPACFAPEAKNDSSTPSSIAPDQSFKSSNTTALFGEGEPRDDPKKFGGLPESGGACEQAKKVCIGNAERLYDKGWEGYSAKQRFLCLQSERDCFKNQTNVRTNPRTTSAETNFPPNPDNNGGGTVIHKKWGSFYIPPSYDPIGKLPNLPKRPKFNKKK